MSHLNINGVDKPLDHIRLNNVRSENLFDMSTAIVGERVLANSVSAEEKAAHSDYIDVTGISSLTVNKRYSSTNFYFYSDKTNNSIAYVNDFTANVPAGAKYCRINILKDDVDATMLNTGSTALPYQPYLITKEAWEARTRVILHGLTNPLCGIGTYKDTLDLSTGVLTRYVKKLVFDGTESWSRHTDTGTLVLAISGSDAAYLISGEVTCMCTHYPAQNNVSSYSQMVDKKICMRANSSNIWIRDTDYSESTDFKSYLAQQYANGTPVTVWYILATPETEQITVPSDLTGIVEGYLTQTGTPTPTNPVYPTANGTLEQGGTYSLDTGAYAIAWGRADTFTGTNSISARCYGLPVKSWEIDGNSQQNGVPSPDNIIMPTFCGVRTANLLDTSTATLGKYINSQGIETDSTAATPVQALNHTDYIEIQPNTDYTYYYKFRYGVANTIALCWFDTSKNLISRVTKNITSQDNEYTLMGTSPVNAAFCIINFAGYLPNESMELSFNIGSAALPYEPYGWAEKITSAGQTQTVYLGQTQTLRRVRKLVLTGTEDWTYSASGNKKRVFITGFDRAQIATSLCSHFVNTDYVSYPDSGKFAVNIASTIQSIIFGVTDMAITSATDWTTYLATQYAAGTPVTVWYVLATTTTGIVNEPLAKIGDYADTLTSDQAGITIPTTDGSTTISVDTPLAPSRFEVKLHAKPI